MHLCERRHLDGIVCDECRLDECALAELTEEFVDELALAHCLVHVHTLLKAECADFLLCLAIAVESCLLLDGVEDGEAAVRSLEADDVAVNLALRLAVYGYTDLLKKLLGESHHPVIVLILYVQLHAGELRVVVAVHTLVTEVLADFVNTLKAAYDKTLQIKLCCDTHIHILVESVEVCDKRTCRSATGDSLQCRSLHLCVASLIKHSAECADDSGTLEKCVLHAVVNDEVNVALTITKLRIVELVVCHAVLILNDRQRLEALRKEHEFLCMYRNLAGLCTEHEALHTDEVTDVEEFLEYCIIEFLVLVGADLVASHVNLDTALRVLQLSEACLTHHAAAHHSSGYHHLTRLVLVLEVGFDVSAEGVCGEFGCWIRVDTHIAEGLKALSSYNLLFTKF